MVMKRLALDAVATVEAIQSSIGFLSGSLSVCMYSYLMRLAMSLLIRRRDVKLGALLWLHPYEYISSTNTASIFRLSIKNLEKLTERWYLTTDSLVNPRAITSRSSLGISLSLLSIIQIPPSLFPAKLVSRCHPPPPQTTTTHRARSQSSSSVSATYVSPSLHHDPRSQP